MTTEIRGLEVFDHAVMRWCPVTGLRKGSKRLAGWLVRYSERSVIHITDPNRLRRWDLRVGLDILHNVEGDWLGEVKHWRDAHRTPTGRMVDRFVAKAAPDWEVIHNYSSRKAARRAAERHATQLITQDHEETTT